MDSQWRAQGQYGALLARGVRAEKVGLWLRAVCRAVVPHALIGGRRNWRALSRNLPVLLASPLRDGRPEIARGRRLTNLMLHGISTRECGWLHPQDEHSHTPHRNSHAPHRNSHAPQDENSHAPQRNSHVPHQNNNAPQRNGNAPPRNSRPPHRNRDVLPRNSRPPQRNSRPPPQNSQPPPRHGRRPPANGAGGGSSGRRSEAGGGPPPPRYSSRGPAVLPPPRYPPTGFSAAAAERQRQSDLRLFIHWLTHRVLLPLTKRVFVCSATTGGGGHRYFWPRGVWLRMQRMAARRVKRTLLTPITRDRAVHILTGASRSLGAARLRLVPKNSHSFRAIFNLSRPAVAERSPLAQCGLLLRPVNLQLRHAFGDLTDCAREMPNLMGVSVLSMEQVHQRWRAFAAARRATSPTCPLHFASTDVTACYDTMSQPRTLAALDHAMAARGWGISHLRQALAFRPTGHRLAMRSGFEAARGTAQGAHVGAPQLAAVARRAAGSLIIDRQSGGGASGAVLLSALRQLVSGSLAVADGRFYLQASGVPQGSVASALLCCLHYGALDLTLLANYLAHQRDVAMGGEAVQPQPGQAPGGGAHQPHPLPGGAAAGLAPAAAPSPPPTAPPLPLVPSSSPPTAPGPSPPSLPYPSLLLRLIDDSLLVTADAPTRDGFLASMGRGFPDFGCGTSVAKTKIASAGAPSVAKTEMASLRAASAATSHSATSLSATSHSATSHSATSLSATSPTNDSPAPVLSTGASLGSLGGAGPHDPQDLRASAPGPSATDGHSTPYFGWCGLLLNMRSCEVHPDMSRRRAHVRPPPGRPHPGCLRARMRAAAKPQLRSIFIDPRLNSSLAVRRNLHHALLHAISAGAGALGRAAAARAPGALEEAVRQLVGFVARVVRNNQRRCLGVGGGGGMNTQGGGGPSGAHGEGAAQGEGVNTQGGGGPCSTQWEGAGASTLVDRVEVEWLAWTALAAVLPASLPAPRLAARRRRDAIEAAGRIRGRSLQLLRAAADPRSLIMPT